MISPINSLFKARSGRVRVVLKNGIIYDGKLEKSDDFMNLLLTKAEETMDESTISYPKAFIKGNNILFIQIYN